MVRRGGLVLCLASAPVVAPAAQPQSDAAGIDHVALETFTIGRGWERGPAHGRIVAPIEQALHVESLGWMPSTPEGGMEGDIVLVPDLAPERIAAQSSLKGRIAMLPDGEPSAGEDMIAAKLEET